MTQQVRRQAEERIALAEERTQARGGRGGEPATRVPRTGRRGARPVARPGDDAQRRRPAAAARTWPTSRCSSPLDPDGDSRPDLQCSSRSRRPCAGGRARATSPADRDLPHADRRSVLAGRHRHRAGRHRSSQYRFAPAVGRWPSSPSSRCRPAGLHARRRDGRRDVRVAGRHRAGERPALPRGPAGRPAEERVPVDAGPRTAQPARPDPQRQRGAPPEGRRSDPRPVGAAA